MKNPHIPPASGLIPSRIVGHSLESPENLLANPLNFRRHPGAQQDALRGSLGELGWLKSILVNKTTGHVIDGHLRCEEAMRQGQPVPVDWVELSEDEERLALAVLDPITEMAYRDQEVFGQLLDGIATQDAGLQALLDSLGTIPPLPPPGLDELAGEHDSPSNAVFWPVLKIKVSPEIAGRFESLMRDATGTEEWQKFGWLLDRVVV